MPFAAVFFSLSRATKLFAKNSEKVECFALRIPLMSVYSD